ncbi:MAG TPA: methyltransferase [Candidatus Binatia bacterium]|nr:methyltransferase [Candidatus Binatia bacterium]
MPDPNAIRELLALVRGHRLTDIVTTAARLRIPEAIAGGARDPESIAAATSTHAPTLARLLRALAAAGVLHEAADGGFDLTALGEAMLPDVPGSVAPWVALLDREYIRDAWRHLEHSLRTGENTFTALHGEDIWAWRGTRPDEAAIFNRAMAAQSAGVGQAVASAFEFGARRVVADIAGGTGSLLAQVLRAHPHLRGILFDQPSVTAGDVEVRAPDLADRCDVVGGSFFDAVPAGADVYMLKAILHDWEDPECLTILRNIRSVLAPDGSLLVIERVVGPPNEDLEGRLSDLHMLVMPGGRERTREEWTRLLAAGGFGLDDVRPLTMAWQLIVASPTEAASGAPA